MPTYDSLVAGGVAVLRDGGVTRCDIGIRDGRIAAIGDDLARSDASEIIDARDRVVFPGGVDAHYHLGIYRPLAEDALSETESSLVGGATTVISYFRTGQHYLNRTGPYREILPEVLGSIAGHAWTDVGFHIAPMTTTQLDEIDWMVGEAGIASFKYFMFYKGLNLAGDSTDAQAFTMSDSYDFGHLYALMEKVRDANAKYGVNGRISLSLHCENAELIKFFIKRLTQDLPPLRA
jgi:dihydroorotase-like cyclic amidohydrolase